MTLAQQLRHEGIQIGLQRGLQEGILEALEIRFDQVPQGLREAVAAIQDHAQLRRLNKVSIQAATLEDLTRSL